MFCFLFYFLSKTLSTSGVCYLSFSSLLWKSQKTRNFCTFHLHKIDIANGFLPFLFVQYLSFLSFFCRKRNQSVPLLLFSKPNTRLDEDQDPVTTAASNTTNIRVRVDVSQHEFWHEVPGRIKLKERPKSQEQTHGRLHRAASRFLTKAANTSVPTAMRRRRFSTPVLAMEEVQGRDCGNDTAEEQATSARIGRRKSLLSRARSLRGVKSLSDLKAATVGAVRIDKDRRGQESSQTDGREQGAMFECAVVRVKSVNSATSAPLYTFGGNE